MRLTKQATDVLDPIIVAATWTASITAAAGTRFSPNTSFKKKKKKKKKNIIKKKKKKKKTL